MPTDQTTNPKIQKLQTERLTPPPHATQVRPPSKEAQRIVGAMLAKALGLRK